MKALIQRYQTMGVVALAIALPVLIFVLFGDQRQDPGLLERPMITGVGKLQSHNDYVVGNASNIWDSYIDLIHTRRDNEDLRRENAKLREENIGLQGILQQNARLTKLVGFKQQRPIYQLEPARVIAADMSPFFRVLRLRLETETDSIEPEMPVVSSEGVVGRIERVDGRYCDVMLTVDSRSKIDIMTQLNRSRGILSGTGEEDKYQAKIAYLLRRDEVEEGELVVTSGRAGTFPKELPVGRITSVDSKSFGLYQEVTVEPIVDFSRLEEVYIITGIKDQTLKR
ncbi:MAG: rod shape-determining protein MreC [Proteobacteria bacterium]|nr:rod shape-determining protein MreC [Pseudomonadota bacterium]MBQ4360159.1 rod shape-determining protein MreC [Pseudomonadota bacterium]